MPKLRQANVFPIKSGDPLAGEHAAVSAWIEEATAALGNECPAYSDKNPKTLPTGRSLLAADPHQSVRLIHAAIRQFRYFDYPPENLPIFDLLLNNSEWFDRSRRGYLANAAAAFLLRRLLPFQKGDLIAILEWGKVSLNHFKGIGPIASIIKALGQYLAENALTPDLFKSMRELAQHVRQHCDNNIKRLGTQIEKLCVDPKLNKEKARQGKKLPVPRPVPAGSDKCMVQLKRWLKILPPKEVPQHPLIGPDHFPLNPDSPLRKEHEFLNSFFEEFGKVGCYKENLKLYKPGLALLALKPKAAGKTLLAAAERHFSHELKPLASQLEDGTFWNDIEVCISGLMDMNFSLEREDFFDFLLYFSVGPYWELREVNDFTRNLIAKAEKEAESKKVSEGERYVLWLFLSTMLPGPPLGAHADEVERLAKLIGDGVQYYLVPGEAWADAVNQDISKQPPSKRQNWAALFEHMLNANGPKPSGKWLKTAESLASEIGKDLVRQFLEKWLLLVEHGRSFRQLGRYQNIAINEENAICLRGLIWLAELLPGQEGRERLFASLALWSYKKVPGIGARAVKIGNAAVFALSRMATPGASGQLAMLKVRIKFGTAQKEIEKAFNQVAQDLTLPRDQIEELVVPGYGLEEVGFRSETLGDYRVDLRILGSNAGLNWFDNKGKMLKAVPAAIKSNYEEELKELQQSLKDIQGMLPAQRDRIDSLFLGKKSWPMEVWRDRYLNHPLIGTVAGRLLWVVDQSPALFIDGIPTGVNGAKIKVGKNAQVALWHPIGRKVDEVLSWRQRLEELKIIQPFKQAHREIYLLTDAERNTQTYSNRFAGHILRQHQFHALCAARRWKNKIRLAVDACYPPASRDLPEWGLRAEFWVDGVDPGDDSGINDIGTFLRIATDQVRFYRSGAPQNLAQAGTNDYRPFSDRLKQEEAPQPIALDQVDPLVFSEVMRDIDLFVGVASVGNDPAWQDGGPQGQYRDYWHGYSFGDLSGTATIRRQVLERLLPRLKIADRCSLAERFLVVRGSIRTYKIHLGSGNILMEPNDQYLCIVSDYRSRTEPDGLFLPFEGDNTLSVIISKALLLADDRNIKDVTITRQIGGG